jgi:hypothetical protein
MNWINIVDASYTAYSYYILEWRMNIISCYYSSNYPPSSEDEDNTLQLFWLKILDAGKFD